MAGHPPLVGKKKAMGNARHGEFGNGQVQLFTHRLNSLVHVIDAQVLAHEAQEMFSPAGDNDLTFLLVEEADGIADQVAPGTCGSAQQDGIIPAFFHLMDHIDLGVLHQVTVGVKILIVEGDEFEKDVLVGDEAHPAVILGVLVSDETFRCKIGLDVGHRFPQELLEADAIGLKRYPTVYEEGKVGPDLVDIVQLVALDDLFHTKLDPSRYADNESDI